MHNMPPKYADMVKKTINKLQNLNRKVGMRLPKSRDKRSRDTLLLRASELPLSVPPVSPDDPLSRDPDYTYRSEEPEESSEEEFDSQEALDDWMVMLRLKQRKMLSVTLMESFKTRQKMNVKDAAREAGSIVEFSDKTVRKYRNNFFANKGSLTPLKQGSTSGTASTMMSS